MALVLCSSSHLIQPGWEVIIEAILQLILEQDLGTRFTDCDKTIQKNCEDIDLGAFYLHYSAPKFTMYVVFIHIILIF